MRGVGPKSRDHRQEARETAWDAALPDCAVVPSGQRKGPLRASVSSSVPSDFPLPIVCIGHGHSTALATVPMPETTVHKYSKADSAKDDVWVSRNPFSVG